MGKKGKVGKQRKDSYYKLAKQKGFRSRAAFKLIQLNRKFQFLENSRVCIDLCAAPGGWLQVASEYMPVSSVIVGVDLVPIDPIRNVITFQGDITTKECSEQIEKTLTTWKADVVLHDGAPNIGKNWLHDAYNQNLLVVSALKLACSHLQKGGWFITKIFRSMDYNSLLWVFGKLFGKVHATKPPASRQESAEIFVVCQNFRAPSKIDPRFFEPSSLFADTSDFDEVLKKQKADLMKPLNKIKKTKAVGYEGGDVLKTVTDVQFIASNSHMDHLAQCHEIKLMNQDVLSHESTTDEIKECCKDLKVLGRRELLKLLKWRRGIRKDLIAKLMSSIKEDTLSELPNDDQGDNLDQFTIGSDDEGIEAGPELQLDDIELQENEEKRKEVRRLKKKDEKRRKDYEQRVQYGMVNQGDVLIEEEHDLFNLNTIAGKKDLEKIDDVNPDEVLDEQPDPSDIEAQKNSQKKRVKFSRTADVQYFELDKDYDSDEDVNPNDDLLPEKPSEPKIKAPNKIANNSDSIGKLAKSNIRGGGLLLDLTDLNQSKKAAASKFFDQEVFDIDLEKELETDLVNKLISTKPESKKDAQAEGPSNVDLSRFDDASSSDDDMQMDAEENASDSDLDDEKESKSKRKQARLDPEGLALATLMVSSKKVRKDIEDEGWNRFSHADSHMAPKWFRDDEAKHCRRNVPVSQELVKEYKEKMREIDAKPIKKVLQAKARQKRRAMRKMDKVKKKVDAITSNEDMTQREKINQIKNVYKSATKLKKKEVKLVVGKKGLPTKKPGKGKYKMVDSRMKKDMRAKQRRDGKKGKKGTGKKIRKKGKRGNNSLVSSSKGPQRMKSKKGTKSRRK